MTLEKLMEKYPPLLSVTSEKRGNSSLIFRKFVIYDKDKPTTPWLTVEMDPSSLPTLHTTPALGYDWMLTDTFQPQGTTHFILVDLKKMADSKKLDPME